MPPRRAAAAVAAHATRLQRSYLVVVNDEQEEPARRTSDDERRQPEPPESESSASIFDEELLTVPSVATTASNSDQTRLLDEGRSSPTLQFPIPLDPPRHQASLGRMDGYEILNVVGRGGMGIVARAFDEQLHRSVAIKVMSGQLITSQRAHKRFLREARAAASINHPNVVTIHAVSEKDDTPYLVMEYVDGQPLQARIQKDAPLPYEDVLRIGAQIASGLAAAHRHGIIHRDIKPGNVMLEDGIERVKLTDFGLARLVVENSDLTSMGDLVGTPAYMSPEQVNGEELTPSSDLFSLGCVLYAMFLGKSPFHASTSFATANRVRDFHPKPVSSLVDAVPSDFDQLLSRLLSKNPQGRPKNAEEVATILLQWSTQTHQERLSGGLSANGDSKPAAKQARRFPVRLVGAAVILGVLAGGGVWSRFASTPPAITQAETAQAGEPLADGVLTVHPDRGEFSSLAEALAAAQPQMTIELLPALYYGTYEISDPERLAGLRIVGQDGVRLAGPPGTPVIHISSVSGCELRDLVIETSGFQNGVIVSGTCPGLQFQGVHFAAQQPEQMELGMLHLDGGGAGTSDAPIEIANCRFDAGAVGIVVGSHDLNADAAEHIHIHHNRIQAASESYGIPVVVQGHVSDVQIERNLLLRGLGGLSIYLPVAEGAKRLVFRHNTLAGVDVAFFCNDSVADQDVRIEENLVAKARTTHTLSSNPAKYVTWYSGNQWIGTPKVDRDLVESMFTLISADEVQSLDPESPNFAKPSGAGRKSIVGIHSPPR